MALLNLMLLPILAVLSLFDGNGTGGDAGGSGGSGSTTDGGGSGGASGTTAGAPAAAAPTQPGTKPDAGRAGGPEQLQADLARERDRRQAYERELGELRPLKTRLEQIEAANKTEAEKAVEQAKREGASERDGHWLPRVIRSEAKSALAAAGATDVTVAVAAFLDAHRDLKLNDQGDVEQLTETVEAFKNAHPTLFTARVPSGSADQGAQGPKTTPAATLEEALERQFSGAGAS